MNVVGLALILAFVPTQEDEDDDDNDREYKLLFEDSLPCT